MSEPTERPARPDERSREASGWSLASLPADPREEAAIRARVSARLFGVASEAVRIGRYEVGQRLGAGGMGVVFSAHDPQLGRQVALKLLTAHPHDDERHRQRLIGEARALARLSHPNVVQIHEIGAHEGATFLALELVEGDTLRAWQRRPGRRWQELLAAYLDAAEGLAAAHGVGVVHRDVKPSNILIGADGRVRVADFGLARTTADAEEATTAREPLSSAGEATNTGQVLGTPAYMSPEQALGRSVDARSDQFSFSVALFEALYGVRPFEAHELRSLRVVTAAHLRRRVPRSSTAPGWILPILLRGLQPQPEQRFPGIGALVTELREAPRRRARRRWTIAGALVVALAGWAVVTLGTAEAPCPALPAALPGAWDDASRAEIHAQFLASGLPFAEGAFRQVEHALDAGLAAWSAERQASCVATWVARSQSEEQFDLSMACLGTYERTLRGIARRMRGGEARLVAQAHELVRDLGDPAACNRTELLRGGPPQPRVLEVRAEVDALRERLGELRVLTMLGEVHRAEALADELVAASVIHAPLRTEALYRKALVLRRRGDLAGTTRLLDEAEVAAEQLRDDRLTSEIFAAQVELATVELADVARARVYARLHGAKLRRLGGDDGSWADHHARQAAIESLAGAPAAALELYDLASGLRPATDLVGRALDLRSAANALIELGREEEAIARLEAAHRLIVDELGPGHPDLAVIDANLGHALLARNELERADEVLHAALAAHERHGGTDGVGASLTRLALAQVALAHGRSDDALTLALHARTALARLFPATHDDVVTALRSLVNIHVARRSWAPAMEVTDALITAHYQRGEAIPVELHINAGEFLLRTGRPGEAAPHFDRALAILSSGTADQELRAFALNGRAKVALAQGELAAALELFERTRPLVEASERTDLRAEVLSGAARARWRTNGSRAQAQGLAGEALALARAPDTLPAEELDELRRIVAAR